MEKEKMKTLLEISPKSVSFLNVSCEVTQSLLKMSRIKCFPKTMRNYNEKHLGKFEPLCFVHSLLTWYPFCPKAQNRNQNRKDADMS